jgi:hypothetical protein
MKVFSKSILKWAPIKNDIKMNTFVLLRIGAYMFVIAK